jgi:hypothetical protein
MNHKNVTGVFAVIDTAAGLPVGCVEKNKQITNCVFPAWSMHSMELKKVRIKLHLAEHNAFRT